jgi:hypothetical protein
MTFTLNDFSPLEVQIIATAFVLLWFEVLHVGLRIKKVLYTNYWEYRKPWDCRLCTHFWLGSIFVIFFIFTQQLENGLIYLALNFVISYYYDKLQSRSNG